MALQSHLGTSADCPKIGSLLITQLCPALYNLLGNGLYPRVRSFFGQVKNNVWKMVEESADQGESPTFVLPSKWSNDSVYLYSRTCFNWI